MEAADVKARLLRGTVRASLRAEGETQMTDATLFCEVMERRGYTREQAHEAASKFLKIDAARRPAYPYTLPFIWRNRTHYITADRDDAGRLILKRAASV
jgi:hypothetical protein